MSEYNSLFHGNKVELFRITGIFTIVPLHDFTDKITNILFTIFNFLTIFFLTNNLNTQAILRLRRGGLRYVCF